MWIVLLALRRRYTFVVMSLFIAVLGVLTILRTPTDIFPTIDVPVVSVIWQFGGLTPKEMEGRLVTTSERAMTTTVNDIEHIESQIYPGIGVIKIYFQPGANPQAGVAQVTAINQTLLRAFPPGTTPPLIIQYSASSVPVLQLGLSSKSLSPTQLYDLSTNVVRTQLATVQGASIPLPYGGSPRQIQVDLDIPALQAKGLSPTDVLNAVSAQNLIVPSGTVKVGAREYNVHTNAQPDLVEAFNNLPIKTVNGAIIHMSDVASIHDGHAVATNIVNKNGQPGVLLTILKSGNASTIDVVNRIKALFPKIKALLPKEADVQMLFDQSVFVSASVQGVIREAVIAACLTAFMILLFLGSWRSTLVVATSIPLSILSSIILLGALGETINIMTLGGLSLAVGILVDDATVEIENTNRNLAMGHKTLTRAILDGASQIAVPTLVATLSICIVFIPVVFLTGAAKSLFTPLALAVVFAMMSSYLLSRTLVPVMVQALLKKDVDRIVAEEQESHQEPPAFPGHENKKKAHDADSSTPHAANGNGHSNLANGSNTVVLAGSKNGTHNGSGGQNGQADDHNNGAKKNDKGDIFWRVHHKFNGIFESFRDRYAHSLIWCLTHRKVTTLCFGAFFLLSFCLLPFIGQDFFPNVDAGQISLHVQGQPGLRLEETNHLFSQVEAEIKKIVPKDEVDVVLDNIGLPVGGVNLAFSNSATIGALDGDILVSLKSKHGPTDTYIEKLRKDLPRKFPQATFYFEPADITTQILNFGLPAPIDIQIVGRDPGNYALAQQIARDLRSVPGAADIHVHQVNNVPQLNINLDRERAQLVGLTSRDTFNNLLTSLVGTGQVTPSYFLDPKNGVSYLVVVQTPQRDISDLSDLQNTPILPSQQVSGPNSGQSAQLLGNLATIGRSASPQIINHYNVQPTYDIYASAVGRDLGGVSGDINKILARYEKKLPKSTTMVVRGQVQSMRSSFLGLGGGMIFAVMLVYLLMVVNFQSWLDPLIIIMALPGAISGILWMLFVTGTTFNVPSLMGSLMCIGVATSNSILLVTFANERRAEGDDSLEAALAAGFTRLRPVLMTALALVLGMLPMALGLGEGGEQNAPLGRAVIGGASVATFATLFFVPVIYSRLRRKQPNEGNDEIEIDRYVADEEEIRIGKMQEVLKAEPSGDGARNGQNENGSDNRDGGERRQEPTNAPAPQPA